MWVFIFILFILKWIKINDLEEIEKCINGTPSSISTNVYLSNNYCLKFPLKVSCLNQIMNANDSDLSNKKSITSSEADFNFEEVGAELFNLATDVVQDWLWQKKEKKTNQTDLTKHAKLSDKIFDYIYIVWYQRFFFLAWYNDLSYA